MDRVRVVRRGFRYPVGDSLALVLAAGGVGKLTPDQRAGLTWKSVGPGEFCDDMPASSQAHYLALGHIEVVTDGGGRDE